MVSKLRIIWKQTVGGVPGGNNGGGGGGNGVAGLASTLVIHFHGGGFVAQSSASHESYLRRWAKYLHTPILSVDYTLCQGAADTSTAYPRALHECCYAYCWALAHSRTLLGSTAERVRDHHHTDTQIVGKYQSCMVSFSLRAP